MISNIFEENSNIIIVIDINNFKAKTQIEEVLNNLGVSYNKPKKKNDELFYVLNNIDSDVEQKLRDIHWVQGVDIQY